MNSDYQFLDLTLSSGKKDRPNQWGRSPALTSYQATDYISRVSQFLTRSSGGDIKKLFSMGAMQRSASQKLTNSTNK